MEQQPTVSLSRSDTTLTGKSRLPILFVHLPKTGGTSFGIALSSFYAPENVFPSFGELVTLEFLKSLGARLQEPVLIRGHVDHDVLSYMLRRSRTITLLREPRSHAVSLYLHHLREPAWSTHLAAKELGFRGFMKRYWQYSMFQTLGLYGGISPVSARFFDQLENKIGDVLELLDNMTFVGCLEDPETLNAMLPILLQRPGPLNLPQLNTSTEFGVAPELVQSLRSEYDELLNDSQTAYRIQIESLVYNKALSLRTKWRRIIADDMALQDGGEARVAHSGRFGTIHLSNNWLDGQDNLDGSRWVTGTDDCSTFVVAPTAGARGFLFKLYQSEACARSIGFEIQGETVDHRVVKNADGSSTIVVDLGAHCGGRPLLVALHLPQAVGRGIQPILGPLCIGAFELLGIDAYEGILSQCTC